MQRLLGPMCSLGKYAIRGGATRTKWTRALDYDILSHRWAALCDTDDEARTMSFTPSIEGWTANASSSL